MKPLNNKIFRFLYLSLVIAFLFVGAAFTASQEEPWKPGQLLEPGVLAEMYQQQGKEMPLIISIGPAGLIKGSVEAGPSGENQNLDHLKKILSKENKSRSIVIYCGCCPFKNCPNIRPAFSLLNQMNFTNHKLLNLSHNVKVDWIDKGYPVNK